MGFGDFVGGVVDTVVDTGRDAGAGVFGWETTAQKEAREKSEAATKAGEAERAKLEAQNKGLEDGIQGYDPASISTCENWGAYGHQELFDRNKSLDEGKADETGQAWGKLAAALKDLGGRYSTELKQKIAGGWEGEAAEAAGSVGDPLSKWMTDSSAAFELTGNRIKEAGSAASQTRNSVPEPEGHNIARTIGTSMAAGPMAPIAGGGDALAQMKERQEAERAAQETMGRVLGATYQNVDTQVPTYHDMQGKPVDPPGPPPPPNISPPPPPVSPGGGDRSGGGGGSVSPSGVGGGSGGGGGGGAGTGPDMPGDGGPAGSGSAWAPGTGGGGGNPGGPGAGGLPGPGGGSGGVGVGVMPGAGAGAGGGGRGAGGAGAGGAGGRAGGAGSLAAGGRAGAGGVGAGGAAGAAGGAGARGGAAGGRGGAMGGAGGAGRGGQGGNEEEHDRPSWLEEQDDVWMNDMPRTAPPVFGG